MRPRPSGRRLARRHLVLAALFAGLAVLALLAALAGGERGRPTNPLPAAAPSTTSIWAGLLGSTPIPYPGTPMPEPGRTSIDGTYVKLDPSWPQWWLCLRCADYRPAGGIWRLQFDRGVMRLLYDVTGWRSLATYTLEGDRLLVFHDAYCRNVGSYRWELGEDGLVLHLIEDGCAFGLRGENLARQAWAACPAGAEAAGGAGQLVGCVDARPEPPALATASTTLRIAAYPGDSRTFRVQPDLFARASAGRIAQPEGIEIAFSPTSIGYGVNRILWWEGTWIEARTDRPFSAMGVQFLGGPQIGWARVLLDGLPVWQGITGELVCKRGYCGGYVEVSGFGPGPHALRVEALASDYHPVEVAGFGFSLTGGVGANP
ncbi:MAG: hypothetical protein ACRDHY_03250 [Anaerolineales bacterium]